MRKKVLGVIVAPFEDKQAEESAEHQLLIMEKKGFDVRRLRPGGESDTWHLSAVREWYEDINPAELWVFGELSSANFEATLSELYHRYHPTFVDFTEFRSGAASALSRYPVANRSLLF